MVMEFGMSERVGPINIADESNRFLQRMFSQSDSVSDETETIIDREVKSLLTGARDTAHRTIDQHRRDLDVLAEVLLERETLDRRDLDAYFSTGKIPLRVKEGRADGDGDGARPRRDRDAEPEQTEEVRRPATYDGEAERRTHELPSEERR
jgi:cell division protease FtsH